MPEPVSPDVPKAQQTTNVGQAETQAPVAKKPFWLRLFSRKPKTEPTPPKQNPNFDLDQIVSTDDKGKIVLDKPALDKMIARVWKGPHADEARFMESLRSDTNATATSPTEPIDMQGFYTPKEQAAITDPQSSGGLYNEVIAAGENPKSKLPEHPESQPVLDSQGQPVSEYIQQNDPRYADPTIPDYLKVGTPDYIIRQAKGGNYLNDPDELKHALAAKKNALAASTFDSLTQAQQAGADSPRFKTVSMGKYRMRVAIQGNNLPLPEKGTVGFDTWKKLRTANTDLYKIKPEESSDTSEQKQSAWDARRREIDEITDRLGKGIDEGIKETVVAFQMNGINTISSCEGHLDRGMPTPSVDVGAPNRPTIKFHGETEILQNVARGHNLSVTEMGESQTDEARKAGQEAYTQAYEAGETEEFKNWREKTVQLGQKTENFLNEFNATRDIPPEIKLHIAHTDDGGWIVEAGLFEEYDDFMAELERSNEEKQRLLTARQGEMRAFTDFLRTKYFSQS